jgi:hypothetical protein
MTDQEISLQLALAIGHKSGWVNTHGTDSVWVFTGTTNRQFDYRDPLVIWPIAERYSAFPSSISSGSFRKAKAQGYTDVSGWEVLMYNYRTGSERVGHWVNTKADTAAKAVALAVIGMKK